MWRRTTALLALLVLLTVVGASLLGRSRPADAAAQVQVSPGSGPQGTQVTVSGSEFPRFAAGQIYWDGDPAGMPSILTSFTGTFSANIAAPQRPPGTYTISVTASGQTASAPFTITGATSTPTPGPTSTPAATPSSTADPGTPVITNPTPGSVLAGSSVTFQWSTGTNVLEYMLWVGKAVGGGEYYGSSTGRNRSAAVSGLPLDGSTVYVQLRWRAGLLWQSRDYTYTAAGSETPTPTATPTSTPTATPTPTPSPSPAPGTQRWSDGATWGGAVPAAGSAVTIPADKSILLDVSPPALKSLQIEGALAFDDRDLSLQADWIMVHGRLEVGTADRPFTKRATITLTGADKGQDVMGMGTKFLGVMDGGTVDLHGETRAPSWTRLNQTANAGSFQIVLDRTTDWRAGDRIVIASTDFNPAQAEEATIQSVFGTTIRLQQPLRYRHWGTIQTIGGVAVGQRAEVGLLSRNIIVQGSTDSTTSRFGGHVMLHTSGTLRISGVEFARMGQAGITGRYPVHFHLVADASASYLKNSSIHHSFSRCVTIHGTHRLTVQEVVAYDTLGHCYFFEDGAETKNVLQNNLGILTRRPAASEQLIPSDSRPATYWVTNPDNTLRGNVAAGSEAAGFWYGLPEHPTGVSKSPQNDANVWPRRTPLGEFSGNVAHSNEDSGLLVDGGSQPASPFESIDYEPHINPIPPASGQSDSASALARFTGLNAYKNRNRGVWLRGRELEVATATLSDNAVGATLAAIGGTVTDSTIVGETANTGTPASGEATGQAGRSLPRPSEPSFPIRGFEFYDGIVGIDRTTLANFQPTDQREASALGYFRRNRFPVQPLNFAGSLTFVNAKLVYLENPVATADGDKSAAFTDTAGTVTGAAGLQVVVNNPFLLTERCTLNAEWNANICDDAYDWLEIRSWGADPAGIGNTTLMRDDGKTQNLVGNAAQPEASTYVQSSLLARRPYAVDFPGQTPARLRFTLRRYDDNDWVRLALPAPAAGPFIYRDYATEPLSAAASLAALDGGTGDTYFLDSQTGTLYLKLAVKSPYTEWATLDVCATARCQ